MTTPPKGGVVFGSSPTGGGVLFQPPLRRHGDVRVVGCSRRSGSLVASSLGSAASVWAPSRSVGPWCKCPPAAWRPPPLFCPGACRPRRGWACGTQREARLFWPWSVGRALGAHALGGEIEEEAAAAGRRRGRRRKGHGAQRPIHRPPRLESVKARFCLPCGRQKNPVFLGRSAQHPVTRLGHAAGSPACHPAPLPTPARKPA